MHDYQAVTILTISGAIVFGMVLALLGSVKLDLAKQFDLGGKRISVLLAAFDLALIPLMLLCGFLVDLLSAPAVLLAGSLLTTTAIFAMSRAPSFGRAILSVFILGLGAAAVSTATIKMMPSAFFHKPSPMHALCLGHVFIALGALLTPMLSDFLLHRLDFRRSVATIALLCLIPAFLCAVPAFWQAAAKMTDVEGRFSALFDNQLPSKLFAAGVVFFFYVPLEGALSVWVTTYLTDLGKDEHNAALVLSGFWGALLCSRLAIAFIPFGARGYPWLIVFLAFLVLVVLGNLASSGRRPQSGLLVVGFLLGPIVPGLLAVLVKPFDHNFGLAYGCVFAMGSLGGLMLAPFVSARTSAGASKAPFRVPLGLAMATFTATVIFWCLVL